MELAYKTCQHSAAAPFGSIASQEPCWTHSGTHRWDTTVPPPRSLPQNLRVHFLPLQSAWAPAEKCRAQAFRTGLRQKEKKSASTRAEGSQGRTRISPQDCEGFTVPCSLQPCPSVLLCEGELISHLVFCQPRDGKQSPAPAPGGAPSCPQPQAGEDPCWDQLSHSTFYWERPADYRGAGAEFAAGQSESSVSLVSGTGMSESGTRSWFQSKWGSVSTMQGRAKSVSRE